MTEVTITRPRHPLRGCRLRVWGRMRRHGVLELLVVVPDGSKTVIPASWTDLDGSDGCSAGHSAAATLASPVDLLRAVAVISALSARIGSGQAARQSPAKEDDRAAYAAQFAARPASGATGAPDRAAPRTAPQRGGADPGPPARPDGGTVARAAGNDGERR